MMLKLFEQKHFMFAKQVNASILAGHRLFMRKFFTLFIVLFPLISFSQKIKGIVTDNNGKIIPYASVFIKETGKGTNANSEGKYSLKLEPGKYRIVCQHVGFKKEEQSIVVDNADKEINFVLSLQEMTLAEVIVKSGEDPAYEIIRKTIKKKNFYQDQLDKFQCEVYTKGQMRLRDFPKKIFGQKIDFEDGDTSKRKMLYLSETVSKYAVDKPNKEKIEVISSKVSGQSDGLGLAAPRFFSFYNNNILISNSLNPRGFISPVADNALNYYRFKLEGTFFEDGNMVNHIKVIPRRKYEPLFGGYINIVEDDWRIHSVQLQLVKESQMELVDTLRIEQMWRPLKNDVWFISSQVIYPSIKMLGFDAYGSFINIYSDFNIEPAFDKKTFNNTILKYTDSATKRTAEYWEKARPVPLMGDEEKDYKRKDSLEMARKDPHYLDSVDKVRNKFTVFNAALLGKTFTSSRKRTFVTIPPLFQFLNFNPAEGWVINTELQWTKRIDSTLTGRKSLSLSPNLRYGFASKHFNAHLTATYNFGKKYASSVKLSGGKRVFQFNAASPISERGNTYSCLLDEENRWKTYEAVYFRGSFRRGVGEGFSVVGGFQYQDRRPLENITNYTWRDKADREYTPNYPNEIVYENIKPHKVFTLLLGVTWQPGARYIELPERKVNIGSKYPVFSLRYTRSINNFMGSDADFSKWKLAISDNINFKLSGSFRYRIGVGGFIDTGKVQLPDYTHFNGNISSMATEYLNSFQLLPVYQFSNLSRFYMLAHVEHNFKGFLTNKIPGIKKLNLYLVAGANGFYINRNKNYYEYFIGIDNIFKQLRIDFVQSFKNGKAWQNGFRFGFSRLSRSHEDDWP